MELSCNLVRWRMHSQLEALPFKIALMPLHITSSNLSNHRILKNRKRSIQPPLPPDHFFVIAPVFSQGKKIYLQNWILFNTILVQSFTEIGRFPVYFFACPTKLTVQSGKFCRLSNLLSYVCLCCSEFNIIFHSIHSRILIYHSSDKTIMIWIKFVYLLHTILIWMNLDGA